MSRRLAGAAPAVMLLLLSVMTGIVAVAVTQWWIGAPGGVIFGFTASVALSPVDALAS